MDDEVVIEKGLEMLRAEHQQIDIEIRQLMESRSADQLTVLRLKKKKLQVKDAICRVEEQLYPDIIA